MQDDSARKRRNYIKAGVTFLALVALLVWRYGTFSLETTQEVLNALSNSFTIPSVAFVVIGGISKLASLGAYDSLVFSVTKYGLHNLIPGAANLGPKQHNLYEYKQAKDEKGRRWLPEVLFVGLIGLGISIVFVVLFLFA